LTGKWPVTKISFFLLALFLILPASAPRLGSQNKAATLYQRLGGYDRIAAVVDDFAGRLASDPQLARFSAGFGTDSRKRRRQLIVDQLCEAAGGPCYYIGRSMQAAHRGLGITEADWNAVVKHLVESLDRFQVPQKEKDELLAIVSGTKADILATASR
jgi:hemoglobin